jgi:phosphate transport system permease protein
MEDFKPKNAVLRFVHSVIQLNINNLAGVPSIVYGILGVTAFVYMFSLFPPAKANEPAKYEFGTNYYYQVNTLGGKIVQIPCTDKYQTTIQINEPIEATGSNGKFELQVVQSRVGLSDAQKAVSVKQGKKASIVTSEHYWFYFSLPFGKGFLAAGLTLGLVVLPIIIISSQEAIRAVPDSLREASAGMGATRWQTVRHVVLPSATPGIMTGTILSLSRAIGEAAPVLAVMGGIISNVGGPSNLMDNCTALPIVIYKWAKDASRGFHSLSASAIIVLLLLLLLMNSVAIVIRYRAERKNK